MHSGPSSHHLLTRLRSIPAFHTTAGFYILLRVCSVLRYDTFQPVLNKAAAVEQTKESIQSEQYDTLSGMVGTQLRWHC